MASAHRSLKFTRRAALGAAVYAALSACSATPPRSLAPPSPAPQAYDWHGLVIAPLGSALEDVPAALHEVVQFQDEARPNGETLDLDCYRTTGGSNPSFAGRKLDEYLLCFKHDRLYRIEATLQLAADQAVPMLARTCAAWPNGACEGREGQVNFSARLGEESGEPEVALSIVLRAALSP